MKLTRRLLALVLALAMVLTIVPATFAENTTKTYEDVEEDDWFYNAVMALTAMGCMQGVSDTHFAPKATVTRAMIVTVLYRAAGQQDEVVYKNSFSDVPAGKWYSEAVEWAAANGIVVGYGNGTFKPMNTATRQELARIFFQFIQLAGKDNQGREDLSGYADVSQVSDWAEEAMQWAVHNYIVRGRSADQLAPKGTCMRAELAEMMYRMLLSVSSPYYGKTIILHTNDVHGAIQGYATVAALKKQLEQLGADVILVDAGDFSQGTTYVSTTKGADAVTMMNAAGYDVATLGNHEFDYGYETLKENLEKAEFEVICANILNAEGEPVYAPGSVITSAYGLKVAFVGVNTPESQTKANPALIKGLQFLAGADMYKAVQGEVDAVRRSSDVVIALAHLGVDEESQPNRSTDLYANTKGLDFIIDGHSHTVMTEGKNNEPIQSAGTALENVGYIILDSRTGDIEENDLESLKDTDEAGNSVWRQGDRDVAEIAQGIIDRVLEEYGKVFARSEVELNGVREFVRTQETNMGDLITDAMLWAVLKDEGSVKVQPENVVAITNGGGIRASIASGDITRNDVNTVLPFGNTVALVYVTGGELLEALEASTFCTPQAVGAFPQVAGIRFTVDTTKAYDPNVASYPGSTYYGPASINRVSIAEVNGQPFDVNATYAVVTNNFAAAGGDTYYAFASATEQFDTGIPMDEALMEYIATELGGVVGAEYAEAQGRITVISQ